MMTVVAMATSVLSIFILRGVLQLAAGNSASNHTQKGMPAHLLACIAAGKTTTNSAHDTTLAFRGIWVIRCVGVGAWRSVGVAVLGLAIGWLSLLLSAVLGLLWVLL